MSAAQRQAILQSKTFTSKVLTQRTINYSIVCFILGLGASVVLGEISLAVRDARLDCVRARLPVSRTHYNMQTCKV